MFSRGIFDFTDSLDKGSVSRTLLDIPILPAGISPEYRIYCEDPAAFCQWI